MKRVLLSGILGLVVLTTNPSATFADQLLWVARATPREVEGDPDEPQIMVPGGIHTSGASLSAPTQLESRGEQSWLDTFVGRVIVRLGRLMWLTP